MSIEWGDNNDKPQEKKDGLYLLVLKLERQLEVIDEGINRIKEIIEYIKNNQ